MTDQSAANVLFGDTSSAEKPASRDAGDTAKSRADVLFGGEQEAKTPATAEGAKEKTSADVMFGDESADAEPNEKGDGEAEEARSLDDMIDPEQPMAGEFRELVGELNLDDEGAAKLVEMELEHRTEYWERQHTAWVDELHADAEFAADFDGNVSRVRAVVKEFGDEGLVESLSFYGSHPGLIRMLNRIGRELGID